MSRFTRRLQRVESPVTTAPSSELTAADLTTVKSKRILFGHQSVGGNMVDAIPDMYASYGVSPPNMLNWPANINNTSGGFFCEFYVGENYDPLGKISDFDANVRLYGSKLDIAFMKFCFVDITNGVDVTAIFNSYKSTFAALHTDFPNIKFVYVTAALDEYDVDNAVTRQQLNTMLRQEYSSTGRVFDLAAVESTRPNGTRVSGVSAGYTYYQLFDDYSSDGGHLNSTGATVVDKALFKLLATL